MSDNTLPTTKTIMIFGAGLNQLELIREAKKMGIITVVIDPSENPPGKSEADFYFQVADKDYETTKTIAKKYNVNGIVTGQMENPLRMMARLAQELGFVFNSPQVIEQCRDKYLMKQAFRKKGVGHARGFLFSGQNHPTKNFLEENNLTFPLIVKPTDAFSSRGVSKVECFEDLLSAVEESASFSSKAEYIIEEFVEGKELSVEAITSKGQTTIVQYTEKFITPYPRAVELGHLQPAGISMQEKEAIDQLVRNAIIALDIDNSASHTELKITPEGIKIIEVGARLGGDFIASLLTRASTGVSMDKVAIQVALGEEPDLFSAGSNFSFIKYFTLPPGKTIRYVEKYDNLTKMPDLEFAHVFVKAGDIIPDLKHSANRSGCVLVKGNTRDEVLKKAASYEKLLLEKIKYV